ncbi:MAG: hypothetical protein AAF215_33205 [Cyanobacteria bacterium P01_A01_bin.123]
MQCDRLSAPLNETDLKSVETAFKRSLLNQTVLWQSQIAFIRSDRAKGIAIHTPN